MMTTYRVTCPDGQVRHDDFESKRDAQVWAEWGHICEAGHLHTIAPAQGA